MRLLRFRRPAVPSRAEPRQPLLRQGLAGEPLKSKTPVLDWRKRQQARAAVRLCIEEWLEKLPPVYTRPIYQSKCEAVYQHVHDAYGAG